MKDDLKTFLKQTEKIVKDLGVKAGELAKAVEKDASYGTKAGMIKVEQLSLENEKSKLLAEFGKKAYNLMKRKTITSKSLEDLFARIQEIDSKMKSKKSELSKLKKGRGGTSKKKN